MMGSNLLRKHLNSDVLSTAMNLFWRIVSGPITLLLVPLFTTPTIQGFWYTFISLAALTIFADLGFTTIATQFAAHEFAFLTLDRDGLIRGDQEHLDSTGALLHFVMRWGAISGLVVMPVVFAIGFYLFVQKAAMGVWLLPWILFSVGTLVNYWSTILSSFLQGARQVARTQRIGLACRMVQTGVMYVLLILRAGLFALSVATLIGSCLTAAVLIAAYPRSLRQLYRIRSDRKWGHEVISLLWRYAMSWAGGYLNMQIFTPIVFQFKGAVAAGRIGITMAIWMAAINLSTAWFTANIPKINILVERREEIAVGRIIRDLLMLTFLSYAVSIAGIMTLLYVGPALHISILMRVAARFAGIRPVMVLITAGMISLVVNAMAIYLRAHKEEPFLLPSVMSGIATATLTTVAVLLLGDDHVFLGFLISTVTMFPWFLRIYRQKRASWILTCASPQGVGEA